MSDQFDNGQSREQMNDEGRYGDADNQNTGSEEVSNVRDVRAGRDLSAEGQHVRSRSSTHVGDHNNLGSDQYIGAGTSTGQEPGIGNYDNPDRYENTRTGPNSDLGASAGQDLGNATAERGYGDLAERLRTDKERGKIGRSPNANRDQFSGPTPETSMGTDSASG